MIDDVITREVLEVARACGACAEALAWLAAEPRTWRQCAIAHWIWARWAFEQRLWFSPALVHPSANVDSTATVGPRATVAEGATVGEDVYVGEGATVAEGATVGPRATVGERAYVVAEL